MLAGALAMLFSLTLAVSAPLTSFAAGWLTDTGADDWKSTSSYALDPAAWVLDTNPMAGALAYSQSAVIGSYVYLFGGYNSATGHYTNVIYRAPTSDPTAWSNTGATLPGSVGAAQLAVVGSYVYLFGGVNDSAYLNTIYKAPISDPTAWVDTGAHLPTTLGASSIAVVAGNVYLFGGTISGTASRVIYTAPTSNPTAWTDTGALLPAGLAFSSLAVVNGYIYLFGGENPTFTPVKVIYRAPTSDPTSWSDTLAVLPGNVGETQSAVLGDSVFIFGGRTTFSSLSSNIIYKAPLSSPTTWSNTGNTLPVSVTRSQVAIVGGVAYLFDGQTTSVLRAPLTLIDSTPPTPNPMTFSAAPSATTTSRIGMTATTATDAEGSNPVEYLFTAAPCATNGGTGYTSSSWQTSVSYSDSGLQKNQCYSYAVLARDSAGNTGAPSATTSVYTRASAPLPPSFSYVSDHSYAISNSENGNPSNTVFTLQVQSTSPTDSSWNAKYLDAAGNPSASAVFLSDATWDTVIMQNLLSGTTYSVRAYAKNGDNMNTGWSATANVTGASTPPPPMTGTPITGYGWSDTTGWISLSCSNTDTCSTSNYGVYIQSDGTVTGYAWSDTVGWIQFGGLSSFPTGGGTTAANATLIGSTALTGWARACAGTVGGDCSSMTSRDDGWDGWIALSGTGYGPTLSSGSLTGYSWGDTNVGWILWNAATTYEPCQTTSGYQCVGNDSVYTAPSCTQTTDVCSSHGTGWFCSSDNHLCTAPPAPSYTNSSGELTARPSLVKSGATTKLSWSVQDASTCTVSGNGDSWTGVTSASSNCATKTGTMCVTAPITDLTTYALHCVGDGGTLDGSATITLIPSWRER